MILPARGAREQQERQAMPVPINERWKRWDRVWEPSGEQVVKGKSEKRIVRQDLEEQEHGRGRKKNLEVVSAYQARTSRTQERVCCPTVFAILLGTIMIQCTHFW